MWTVRTLREGSQVLVPDYKKNIIRKLLSIEEKINSGSMWKYLLKEMPDDFPSRASVIFFLNDLVDHEYATYETTTGKGGHHRLYYTELTPEQFEKKVYVDINNKLKDALDNINSPFFNKKVVF
ncbi:hypothetical protein ES702_00730 [subsurface metagenome]